MRRLIIAGLLLSATCLALSLSFPRLAVSTGSLSASSSSAAQSFNSSVSASTPATILRTLVYHQITSQTSGITVNSGSPVLSASGNRAVFAISPGSGDPNTPNRIFVVNADGTGERQVDAYTTLCFCSSQADISADGEWVVSTEGVQLRIARADGSGGRELLRDREFEAIRISGDGTKVFFLQRRGEPPTDRGLYVINADGSGLRQIAGPTQIGTLLGIPRDEVFTFDTGFGSTDLSVSHDGQRIVFATNSRGQRMFGVNLDGTGLHQIGETRLFINSVALSADGQKVASLITSNPCCSNPRELFVGNFDGTGQRKLSDENSGPIKRLGNSGDRIQLSSDGAKLLLGSGSILVDVASGAPLQLGVSFNSVTDDPPPVVDEGMLKATMNSSATRFLYVIDCTGNFNGCLLPQLAVLDLNPVSLGQAPSVTEPKIDPSFVLTQSRSAATVSARVTTTNTIRGVGNAALIGGLDDKNVSKLKMVDDGTNGDTTANNGIFTHNAVRADSSAIVGARTMRVKAEVRAGDGRRHATAIDFEPFTVTDQAPSIEVSQTSLDFGSVIIGQSKDLTLTIRNIGNNQLTVNSLNTDNPQFSVPAPAAPFALAPGGQQTVTVRFTPNSVGPQGGRLTIASTDPARPGVDVFLSGVGVTLSVTVNDHRITGGPIPGACDPPVTKTSFTPTDAQAIQWTFVSGFQNGAIIRWEWVQPNGSVYRQFEAPVNNPNQTVCFWDAIGIVGQAAALLPGAWQVRVFYNGAQIVTDTFTISAASSCPTVSGISPTSGSADANVTITGANFTGVTAVRFANNLSANFTINSDTQITATVPSGAVTGPITITKPNCSDAQTGAFTICTYSISPASQSFATGGGQGSVNITTQANCAWTATSNASFITITSGTPGNGSGTLNYSVAANTGPARSGTLTIAGQTFTVNQSGATAGAPLIRIEPTTLSFNVPRGQAAPNRSSDSRQNEPDQTTVRSEEKEREQEKEKEREEEEGDRIQERMEWFYRQRQYPFDQIPERARERAMAEKESALARLRAEAAEGVNVAAATQWTHLGPSVTRTGTWGDNSGRVTSIIVHPVNPNIVYISGAQGGVWRTTDNGATWTPLTDDQPSLAMGALAFDPNNPNIIYAGTGEQNFSLDSYYGNGVLKSTNGGVTWAVQGAAVFARQTISRIVVSQSSGQTVLAAANGGLYRSTDGGSTWTRVLAGVATDVIAAPGNGGTYYSAILAGGVFKSTDGGVSWTKLTNGLPGSNFGRVHLTISSAAPNTLLASFTARDNTLEGLYRTTDGGAGWTKLANTPNILGKQGWYNVSLAIHPTSTNIIYFGGLSLWRSQDGGATWANISNPRDYFQDVHPDQHAIAFNPQNPSVVWIGNDGGVWRSDNGGDTWTSRNEGLSLTQFQTVALHPTNDALAFGGTQDNGIQKYTGTSDWRETRTGDNGSTYFDFNNPTTVYTTYITGYMVKSLNSGEPGTWNTAFNGIPFAKDGGADNGRTAFYAPFTMDPSNPQRLAFGSYRVWYTTDGANNWSAISGDVTGGGVIAAITIAANGARIWTGSSDAQVWRGDLNSGTWSFTSVTKALLPNRSITRIAAHPTDPQTAYIAYSGFGSDHIFRTTDGGATWMSANGGLPDIPVNVVLVDPNNPGTVYAGTDIGVYRSTDQGQNWMPCGTGLPNVAVFDLGIRKNGSLLRAATHGRGMWEIQVTGEQSFTIFNDGDATLTVTGISKQNNAAWLSFTTLSAIPFDIPPKGSAPVRVSVSAAGLNAGVYTERLLVTSNDTPRSPYPTGVFINLNVTDNGGGGGCTFTLAPTSQNFNASGGSGSVAVTAPNGCLWTATANDSWITITSGASGSGNGTVNYSVAANTSASSRSGTLTVAGQTFTVTQSGGSNCTFTIAPTSQNFNASGGNGSVNITTQSGCAWNATSNADWITITSGAAGSGNGTVNYLVAANNTTSTRTGTLTVAGQTFTVTQTGGSSCVFTITPGNQFFSASGGSGSIGVSTSAGCNWTAQSNDGWIVITSGASGSGSGTVNYSVAANSSTIPRAGTITVAGQTFIVGQAGTGATCGLLPISIGQTVNGELVTTDCRSPIYGPDYYADLWYFTASAGQQVAIQLNSSEFDAYVTLIGPDGDIVEEDDDGGGGTNARIPMTSGFLTLPKDGTYIIEASSSFTNELGKYTLSLTAPAGCTFTLAPTAQSFNASGGNGSVNVTTQSGCAWNAVSNADWIVITSGASGSGNGTLNYSVAANTSASSRSGTLTVAGQTFTVTQSGGSNCTFTIAPTSQNFNASGGTGSVNVTSQQGCNWTARSNAEWITITSGAAGGGNGTVSYSVAANNGIARTGTLTVAGQTFTVTQSASGSCSYTLSPASQSFNATGGSGNVSITTTTGCAWNTAANVGWISILTGSESGSGNGSVGYSVAANTSASSRSGTLTIAGQTFTINQSGSGGTNCPTVSGISPASGASGSTVAITGANFTGVSAVKFANNVTAQFTINSDTQITATVPAGAVTGPIMISKSGCNDVQTGTFTVTTGPCITVSIPGTLTGDSGSGVTIPVMASDTTGQGALSYDFTLTYDPAVLRLQSTPFDRTGTLSSAMTITTNTGTPGQLRLSAFGASPLAGGGTLLNLKFDLIGATGSCSNLTWTSFRFNEGTPCATTSNGRICAVGGSISGQVSYCISPKAVPGVQLTAAGTPQMTAVTNSGGTYQLPGLGGGAYTLTPAKTGDANGITSFDAAQVAQHVVGLITLNSCQQVAGDASGDGSLSSFDAALIAQFVVGISNPVNKAGTWKFVPPNRSYPSLNGEMTSQNFDAVLIGDVSGNWSPGAGVAPSAHFTFAADSASVIAQTTVSLPSITATPGTNITIPITVGDLTGKNIIAYDFDLTFDPNLLQPLVSPVDAAGTISAAMTITPNATTGRLRVSAFGTSALSGAGTLLKLSFKVIGSNASGALTWQKFVLNEEALSQSSLTNGTVTALRLVTTVSAANYGGPELAAESIVAAFGTLLATRVEAANTIPLPTSLAGTTVKVKDSAGTERLAPLFFVSPQQINYQLPPGTAAGQAIITITSGDGAVSGGVVSLISVVPSVFTADSSGSGLAAAYIIRVKNDNSQSLEFSFRFDAGQNKTVAVPVEFTAETQKIVLVLFGTGWRARSSLSGVGVKIGGLEMPVEYAGPQGGFVGLDQLNVELLRTLAGRGEADIVLTVEGRTANTTRMSIK
ncbi:MAG TPA: BACON domain-containing carbohydrate-binding protein [Blastocatellia bacterium]|nr:BACON domain-containing carbohydrate-binding protein [Blastocatellia bacterium]